MNENLNLVEILKDCPKGTKLYSPLFGEVEFEEVYNDEVYPIVVKVKTNPIGGECTEEIRTFSSSGILCLSFNGECMLFPSKYQRDWSKFKPKKPKFDPKTLKPFDKVLTRDRFDEEWYCGLFSHCRDTISEYKYALTDCCSYAYCIPYNEDTKHLVGTTKDAPEFYRYWEDVVLNDQNDNLLLKIKDYINTNYTVKGELTFEQTNGVYIVNCDGDVIVKNRNIDKLTEGFEWGEVNGNFRCSYCTKLISLEGAPKKVGRSFNCYNCETLESLKGAPKEVGKGFHCTDCDNIKSLKGAPKKVGGDFYCSYCEKLESLEGAPEKVGGFSCSGCTKLKSLEGAPKEVSRFFNCANCTNLISLKGAPEKVGEDFYCIYCNNLNTLEGAPKVVGGYFRCDFCRNLESLKGAPKEVGGYFYCSYCEKLESLEGSPEKVGKDFRCNNCCELKSLKGAPEKVGGEFNFDCCYRLESLNGW